MRAVCRAVVAACLASVGFGAGAASAATVTFTREAPFDSSDQVRYVAARGETNKLTVDYAADAASNGSFAEAVRVTVTDSGAVVIAKGSCTSLSRHSAVCEAPDPLVPGARRSIRSVRALLGDMNDRAVTTRAGPNVRGRIELFGARGDDVLNGSPAEDMLDGGGGSDVLRGGAGSDVLSDGDRDGAADGLAPDADTLDGGPGVDTLSYESRTRGVVVDLANDGPAGELGEGDVARRFEWISGGKGNDLLAGDRESNEINGNGGRNRLIGRGGSDILRQASGHEILCGRGFDFVVGPRARTRIPGACESLTIGVPPRAEADADGATLRPTPQRKRGALGFDVGCPASVDEPEDCRATVRIRTAFTHRLIAAGSLDRRRAYSRFLRLELTALGRRLHEDHSRQLVRTVIRGPLMRKTAWTIGF